MRFLIFILTFVVCFSIVSAEITGEVVKVIDGDTIVIKDGKDKFKVRLAHIDAPELTQECGDYARNILSVLCDNKNVYVEFHQIDNYGRIVGTVYLYKIFGVYSENVNKKMVRKGAAWWYEKFSDDSEYAILQSDAKKDKIGIWGENCETCIPPWQYRKMKKNGKHSGCYMKPISN